MKPTILDYYPSLAAQYGVGLAAIFITIILSPLDPELNETILYLFSERLGITLLVTLVAWVFCTPLVFVAVFLFLGLPAEEFTEAVYKRIKK
jgi:hypothetical protein